MMFVKGAGDLRKMVDLALFFPKSPQKRTGEKIREILLVVALPIAAFTGISYLLLMLEPVSYNSRVNWDLYIGMMFVFAMCIGFQGLVLYSRKSKQTKLPTRDEQLKTIAARFLNQRNPRFDVLTRILLARGYSPTEVMCALQRYDMKCELTVKKRNGVEVPHLKLQVTDREPTYINVGVFPKSKLN